MTENEDQSVNLEIGGKDARHKVVSLVRDCGWHSRNRIHPANQEGVRRSR